MHIILTHEQADFDALSSLLGAHLMDKAAIPVLPRRMNRNVRAFLTLYGGDLPFVDPRDLTGERINKITLVDTQSLTSVKGMTPNPTVQVIDHHQLRDDLPADWSITETSTGANTTFFVDFLYERNIELTTITATLLLIGIYEDTGSLTFSRTSGRDLRAAGYLLDHGASLQIAGDFLNHPLSPQQQTLYDQLRERAIVKQVHGHMIIIACCETLEIDEELSTIAHKMRDHLDPDALIMLVTTGGGVQLVARSTNDNIDVAEIASYFGGGGHDRAAASLIKGRELEEICSEVIQILPKYVKPAVTVSQIMSQGPQVLTPETTVDEAARRMYKYGYEGYPVVQKDRIVGLLTRRAVDKALSHKLNLNVASLLEAGDHSVTPDDSVEHLQRVMTDSGWGQVPVVDPEGGGIIGIVTRTDLIKTLTPKPKLPSRHNLAERLESSLSSERLSLLKKITEIAKDQRFALYIVGGFVRDLLLEIPSPDFDLVVEGDAIGLAKGLVEKFGGRVTSHARFGTAKWLLDKPTITAILESTNKLDPDEIDLPDSLDLVTARTEFYAHPTALPTVERGSIKLDLHRRDFTINTIALRLDGHHYGELHDYWGGLTDIQNGLIRVLHSLSFVDDPTRMLRAVRFEKRFDFIIEERTLELLQEALSLLDRVSGDRIRHEIDRILAEDQSTSMLERLDELDLLSAIQPHLHLNERISSSIDSLQLDDIDSLWDLDKYLPSFKNNHSSLKMRISYILWMLWLNPNQLRVVSRRLKLAADLKDDIVSAQNLFSDMKTLKESPPSDIVDHFDDVPPIVLYSVYHAVKEDWEKEILIMYVRKWKHITPTISGHDLKAMGIPPGPLYKEILMKLRDEWLDGNVTDVEQEASLLKELITNNNH